jgi:hypothetical protein
MISSMRIITNKRRNKMNSYKRTAIIVGVLFITATVASSLTVVLTGPLNAPDGLINVSANATQLIIGALLLLIDSIMKP